MYVFPRSLCVETRSPCHFIATQAFPEKQLPDRIHLCHCSGLLCLQKQANKDLKQPPGAFRAVVASRPGTGQPV
jgi:hypothetical protein